MGLWRSMLLLNAHHLWTSSHNKDALKLVRCILCHSELTWDMWLLWEDWKIGTSYTILRVWWLSGKESAWNSGDAGSVHGSGRAPRRRHGSHSSILVRRIEHEQGSLPGVSESQTRLKQLSMHARIPYLSISTSFFYWSWKKLTF